MARLFVTFALGLTILSCPSAAFAGAEELCLAVMRGDIKDSESRYSEEDTFRRYQNILKNARFREYQEMVDQGGSLGLNIPIADALLGLSAEGKSNSGTFRKEVDEFVNSTFDEARSHSKQDIRKETINGQLLSVVENCHNNYFGSLRDRVGLSTTVDLNDYSSFTISLESTIPASTEQGLIIKQIEPTGLVRCMENGEPVALDKPRLSQQALMECTKEADKRVNLRIRTNAGISNVMVLPSPPPPEKPRPPIAIVEPPKGYEWTESPQPSWPTAPLTCNCAATVVHQGIGATFSGYIIVNNCAGAVTVSVMKEQTFMPNIAVPAPAPGRKYTTVTVQPGGSQVVEIRGSQNTQVIPTSCSYSARNRTRGS